ncbi:MAG TPA: SIMPL domain-containing protein [Gemmatimonadaceae bacterium]
MRIVYSSLLARVTLAVSSLLCLATSATAAQSGQPTSSPSASAPEIATSGRGEISVAPDLARLQVTVETRSSSASAAAADNAVKLTKTVAAVRVAGVDSAQIGTSGYSVVTDYDSKSRPIGFVVRNGLRIDVQRIADVGKIIDAALSSGSTQVNGIQFLRLNVNDSRRSAVALAVAEARRDAEVLARAAGGSLGRLIYLTSGFAQMPRNFELQEVVLTSALAGASTRIMPGDLTVVAVANARWQFLPRPSP